MKKNILTGILIWMALGAFSQIADSSRREIKLQGVVNFRDLGGYATKDGKHVKWGRLYRSAEISHLTAGGLDTLTRLAIAWIADFRGPFEVKAAPDRVPTGTTRMSLPAGSENTGDSNYMKQLLQSVKGEDGLVSFYSNISSFSARYKPLFAELLQVDRDSAVLFHCTAGKDRTGIAAALILSALNVEDRTIMEDYLATDYYRKRENERAIKGMQQLYKMDEATARNLMGTKEIYLQATFNSIRSQYGTMDNFFDKVLDMPEAKRAVLRQKFLE